MAWKVLPLTIYTSLTVKEYNLAVEEWANKVYRFIYSHTKNQADSQDIVQESFARLWVKHEEVNAEKVKSYLFTTAYHLMIDGIKKQRRMDYIEDQVEEPTHQSRVYTGIQELLHKGLSKLPEIQKSIILLRDYEGYAYNEIGEITGLSESQVKVYLFRARTALKSFIGPLENVL